MKLIISQQIADDFVAKLEPYCDRISIAGSVRRKKPEAKDIEVVCIPKTEANLDLFDVPIDRTRNIKFVDALYKFLILKGQPETGKYLQLNLGTIKVDLFIATTDNWGLIFAIRTGSAEFSHNVLAKGWVRQGYKSIEGMLTNVLTGEKILVREEKDLFKLIKVKYIEPEYRI